MESVEQIQKINSLAKELMRHGMASSSDDAVKKANVAITGENRDVHFVTEDRLENELRLLDSRLHTIGVEVRGVSIEIKGVKEQLCKFAEEMKGLRESLRAGESAARSARVVREVEAPTQKKEEDCKGKGKFSEKDVSIDKIFYYGQK